jgi:hypothetical protein
MAKKKKHKNKGPRRHRMKRDARLQSARAWLLTMKALSPRQIAHAYHRWYKVDWESTITELSQMGVALDSVWVAQLRSTLACQIETRAIRRAAQISEAEEYSEGQDENFAYIAGYTPGGAPFGVTWEEWKKIETQEKSSVAELEDFPDEPELRVDGEPENTFFDGLDDCFVEPEVCIVDFANDEPSIGLTLEEWEQSVAAENRNEPRLDFSESEVCGVNGTNNEAPIELTWGEWKKSKPDKPDARADDPF